MTGTLHEDKYKIW